MPIAAPSRSELLKWSPKADETYVDVIASHPAWLQEAGILDSPLTLCHFMGQIGGETNGLKVKRESMYYTSAARIRQVWPARSRRTRSSKLSSLVRNPVALASWAYNGRMGNRRGTTDGYDFRGGGLLQTTGRYAVKRYARKLGYDMAPDLLDDPKFTLQAACLEWRETGCSAYAEENDILAISKIINTGSATSGIRPNGMNHRKHWYRKALDIWGNRDQQKLADLTDLTEDDLRKKGSETISNADLIETGAKVAAGTGAAAGVAEKTGSVDVVQPKPEIDPLDSLRQLTESTDVMTTAVNSIKGFITLALTHWWVACIAAGLGAVYLARKVKLRRLIDARSGRNSSRLDR